MEPISGQSSLAGYDASTSSPQVDLQKSARLSSGANVRSVTGTKFVPTPPVRVDYREMLRPRKARVENTRTLQARPPVELLRKPVVTDENGCVFIDPVILFDRNCVIDFASLKSAKATIDTNKQVVSSPSKIAGTGAHATRAFKQNEIIGFYEGTLVKRKKLPDLWEPDYQQHFRATDDRLVWPMYCVWSDVDGGELKFHTDADIYTAWSRVKLGYRGEEIGIDASEGGNHLRSLNHSQQPNAILLPVLNPATIRRVAKNGTQTVNPESFTAEDIMIVTIALKPIEKGEEITFFYGRNPDFSKVGLDIIASPRQCMHLKNNKLCFLPPEFWGENAFEQNSGQSLPDQPIPVDSGSLSDTDTEIKTESDIETETETETESDYEPESDYSEMEEGPQASASIPSSTTSLKEFTQKGRKRKAAPPESKIPTKRKAPKKAKAAPTHSISYRYYLQLIEPTLLEKAREDDEALLQVINILWNSRPTRKAQREIALFLNQFNIPTPENDWWDSESVWFYLYDQNFFEGDEEYPYMPFSVLKDCDEHEQNRDTLKKFIQAWVESGSLIPALSLSLKGFGIQPPAEYREFGWTSDVISELCPEISVEKTIAAVLAKVEDMGGAKAIPHESRILSPLLWLARGRGAVEERALLPFIAINAERSETKIANIASHLNHANIPKPGSGKTDWTATDILSYLIDKKVVDFTKAEDLLPYPAETVMELNIPEEYKAHYMAKKLASDSDVHSVSYSLVKNYLIDGKKSKRYKLIELLNTHCPKIQFNSSLESVVKKYQDAYDASCLKQPRSELSVAKEAARVASSELLFRCALEGVSALRIYINCMKGTRVKDETLLRRLNVFGLPVPAEFATDKNPAGSNSWVIANIRKAHGESGEPQHQGSEAKTIKRTLPGHYDASTDVDTDTNYEPESDDSEMEDETQASYSASVPTTSLEELTKEERKRKVEEAADTPVGKIPKKRRTPKGKNAPTQRLCPELSAEEGITAVLAEVEQIGGAKAIPHNSRILNPLLKYACESKTVGDRALHAFITINHERSKKIGAIAGQLKGSRVPKTDSKDTDWTMADVLGYLIKKKVVDITNIEALLAYPIWAVMGVDIPEENKIQYIAKKLVSDDVCSVTRNWINSFLIDGSKYKRYRLIELLHEHCPDLKLDFKREPAAKKYTDAITASRTEPVGDKLKEAIGTANTASTELLFICAFEGVSALRFYFDRMKDAGIADRLLPRRLNDFGLPIPEEFATDEHPAGLNSWSVANIKQARGESSERKRKSSKTGLEKHAKKK